MSWLQAVYSAAEAGQVDRGLDMILSEFDDAFHAGRFAEADGWVAEINMESLSAALIVGVLTVTWHAREHLPSRPKMVEAARERLTILVGPDRTERLMKFRS